MSTDPDHAATSAERAAGPTETAKTGTAELGHAPVDGHWIEPIKSPRFNYWVSCLEGALYGGGLAFINPNSVLPKMIESLGGPPWLISLTPVMGMVGMLLPPILVAHRIERMRRFKPYVGTCCLLQRLVYGLAALLLLFLPWSPKLALVAVATAPLLGGMFGGFGLVAWQQLFTKCVPRGRRHSLFAMRATINCAVGILAGFGVHFVLGRWGGAFGFGILHALTFGVMMISFSIFSMTREPKDYRKPPEKTDFVEHLSSVPKLIFADRHFILLLLVKFFRNGTFIIVPYLSIHCLQVLGKEKEESFLGPLLVVQMAGSIVGNLAAGYWGDRLGTKFTMLSGLLIYAAMAAWAIPATQVWEWFMIFGLFGAGMSMCEIGSSALGLEMGRHDKRSTFLAVGALVNVPGMLLAAGICWMIHRQFWLLAVVTLAWVLLAAIFMIPLRERHDGPIETPVTEPA